MFIFIFMIISNNMHCVPWATTVPPHRPDWWGTGETGGGWVEGCGGRVGSGAAREAAGGGG